MFINRKKNTNNPLKIKKKLLVLHGH